MHSALKSLYFIVVFFALNSEIVAQQILLPSDSCKDHDSSDIVSFADSVLEGEVKKALSIPLQGPLTCNLAATLKQLDASGAGARRSVSGSPEWDDPEHLFHDLSGIQNLTSLTDLALRNRGLADITPLAELSELVNLNLHTNWISDITP